MIFKKINNKKGNISLETVISLLIHSLITLSIIFILFSIINLLLKDNFREGIMKNQLESLTNAINNYIKLYEEPKEFPISRIILYKNTIIYGVENNNKNYLCFDYENLEKNEKSKEKFIKKNCFEINAEITGYLYCGKKTFCLMPKNSLSFTKIKNKILLHLNQAQIR